MDHVRDKWEEFLDPDVLRGKLIAASIFIAAYELLTSSIVDRIKNFYSVEFNDEGPVTSTEYEKEVLSRSRSSLYASLAWLRENDAIAEDDLTAFEEIKRCRNQVAHELAGMITGSTPSAYLQKMTAMVGLLRKIEVWWTVNFEIQVNSEFADTEVDESRIAPGPLIGLQTMIDVALGDPADSKRYLEEFRKRWPRVNSERT